MTLRIVFVFVFVVGLFVAACGGDDEPDPTPAATTAATQPVPAASATPTAVPGTPPTPTVEPPESPMPAGPPECGQTLINESARDTLADLEGTLVFVCETEIWTSKPDGTDQRQVTQPVSIDWDAVRLFRVPEGPPTAEERAGLESRLNAGPRWLSDGRIVFASTRDTLALSAASTDDVPRPFVGASELYAVDPESGSVERLTDFNFTLGTYSSPHDDFDPAVECLAPNFCFAGLLVVQPDSAANTRSEVAAYVTEIRFSECCGYLGLIDLSGEDPVLTPAAERVEGEEMVDDIKTWRWSANDLPFLVTNWHLNLFEPIEGQPGPEVRVYSSPDDYTVLPDYVRAGAALSPDGTRVAYCADDTGDGPVPLYVATLDAAEPTLVLEDGCTEPVWSPDGTHLVTGDTQGRIVVIDVESGDVQPVALGSDPDWGP